MTLKTMPPSFALGVVLMAAALLLYLLSSQP